MSKATPKIKVSRQEIKAAYAAGETAVIELVESLSAQYLSVIETLLKQQQGLEARVKALEDKQSKNSRNSSKPPSGDGFEKRTKSLRGKSHRRSGGQQGHPGNRLEWSEQVDEVVTHQVSVCSHCGEPLASVSALGTDRRQVHELPSLAMQVIEHQAEIKCCPACQLHTRASFPPAVNTPVQYGQRVKGVMMYLMAHQLLPSERSCELLSDLFNCSISDGTLYNVRAKCFEQLAPVEAQIKASVERSAVAHFDETSLRVNKQLKWLHVACSERFTYYFVHAKRGRAAMDEMAILPHFSGVSVHDGWRSYAHYACTHALCNAHHLRELRFIVERYEQPWADEMMTLLIDIKTAVAVAQSDGLTALPADQLADFETCYQLLLEDGLAANPPPPVAQQDEAAPKKRGPKKQSPPKNLLDRLSQHQAAVLGFMHDFRVPFDNNQAERDIRMMKLKQKISGCFRSDTGAKQFCRIRGYISTLRKQKLNVLEGLTSTFTATPMLPALCPE